MAPYYLLWFLALLSAPVPLRVGYALSEGLGIAAFRLLKRQRNITLFNLRLAFPEKTEDEIQHIARKAFANLAKVAFEVLKFFHLSSRRGAAQVDDLNTEVIYRTVGQPAIFASAHTGSWELLPSALRHNGILLSGVGARVRQPGVNRFIEATRRKRGVEQIYRDPGVNKALEAALKNNRQLALVADQHAGERGVLVTFMGQMAWAFKGPAKFCLDTGLPMIPVFNYRAPNNRIVLVGGQPIDPREARGSDPLQELAQKFHDQLEDFVRSYPESYFWQHRRFKGTVEGA